ALGRSWSLPTLASRSSTSDLAVTSVGQRVEAEADETGRDDPEQQRPVIGVGELAERTVQRDRGIRVEVDRGLDQGVTDQNEDDSPRDITENTEPLNRIRSSALLGTSCARPPREPGADLSLMGRAEARSRPLA